MLGRVFTSNTIIDILSSSQAASHEGFRGVKHNMWTECGGEFLREEQRLQETLSFGRPQTGWWYQSFHLELLNRRTQTSSSSPPLLRVEGTHATHLQHVWSWSFGPDPLGGGKIIKTISLKSRKLWVHEMFFLAQIVAEALMGGNMMTMSDPPPPRPGVLESVFDPPSRSDCLQLSGYVNHNLYSCCRLGE